MSIRKTVFFTIVCLAVTTSFAFAQGAAPSAPAKAGTSTSAQKTCPPYDDPKKKGDASPMADSIDANKDGKMTKEEYLKAGAPIESFNMFTSKSGKDYVTKQEMLDETPPDGIDTNCDGKFTIEEFHAFGLKGPQGGGQGGAPGGAPAGGGQGGAPAQK